MYSNKAVSNENKPFDLLHHPLLQVALLLVLLDHLLQKVQPVLGVLVIPFLYLVHPVQVQ